MGSVFHVAMIGRWSLPEKGPWEVYAFRAMLDDDMIRSMVEDIADDDG